MDITSIILKLSSVGQSVLTTLNDIKVWLAIYLLLVIWMLVFLHMIETIISEEYHYRFGKIRNRSKLYKRIPPYFIPALVVGNFYTMDLYANGWLTLSITIYTFVYILLLIVDYVNEIRYGVKKKYIPKIRYSYKRTERKPSVNVKHFEKIYLFYYLVIPVIIIIFFLSLNNG